MVMSKSCAILIFFFSTFALTSDPENGVYTHLNPSPTHENNYEERAKVEKKKLKWHMTCT